MIEFLQKGLFTTIQDSGRHNHQRYGVPVAGAMDILARSLANILVGNHRKSEALEVTLSGPTLRFHSANIFAICGADMRPKLNGQPIENNRAYLANAGDTLALGYAHTGARAYIAVSGGFDVPVVMGSKSTYVKGHIGGLDGRAIEKGDTIRFHAPKTELPNMQFRYFRDNYYTVYSTEPVVRILYGPQDDHFSDEGKYVFENSVYTVSNENDRMGYRLNGPAVHLKEGYDGNIISDGIPMGAIQVPNGQPIIMMADKQTTGGYSKIANVIAVDLPLVAQLKTGDKLRFAAVSIEEAQRLHIERIKKLDQLEAHLNTHSIISKNSADLNINGCEFKVTYEEYI